MQLQNLHRVQTPVILNESTLSVGQRNTTGYDQNFYQAVIFKFSKRDFLGSFEELFLKYISVLKRETIILRQNLLCP